MDKSNTYSSKKPMYLARGSIATLFHNVWPQTVSFLTFGGLPSTIHREEWQWIPAVLAVSTQVSDQFFVSVRKLINGCRPGACLVNIC